MKRRRCRALHSDAIFDEGVKRGGFLEGVLKAKDEGLFDYIGMTTHSESGDIIRYLKESPYEFDMVTLPFSPVNPSRTEAIEYCAERGIGVVAMNHLGGGRLGRPVAILNTLARHVGCSSMAEAALRFVVGQPGVTTALNGITFADHAVEGTASIDKGPLTDNARKELVSALSDLYKNVKHFCTACGYCGECPAGILIPEVLQLYTSLRVPLLATDAKAEIAKRAGVKESKYNPAVCTACTQCEKKCPNNLPVSELMAAAAAEWCA